MTEQSMVESTNGDNSPPINARPYIIADDRERDVIAALRAHPADVIPQRLDVADFICSSECAVERKRGDDLVGSIQDGRLRDELTRLGETFERPLLVLEDLNRAFARGNFSPASIYGAMASVALYFGIPIIPTRNAADTALLLFRIATREQEDRKAPAEARHAPKKMSLAERREYFLEGLVNTGPEKAKLLLEHFNTPGAAIDALRDVKIAGTKTGKLKLERGNFAGIKGFGIKWVVTNRELVGGA